MNYLMSIQVLPYHPGDKELYSHTSGAIDLIENSGLTHFVGPQETTVEGQLDELFSLVKKLNLYLAEQGCEHVTSNIKLVQSKEENRIKDILEDYYEFEDDE